MWLPLVFQDSIPFPATQNFQEQLNKNYYQLVFLLVPLKLALFIHRNMGTIQGFDIVGVWHW